MFRAAADLASQDRWSDVYSLVGLAEVMSATFGGVSFAYPPPFAIALRPLTTMGYADALAIWIVIGVAALILLVGTEGRFGLMGLAAMLFPTYVALRFGQFIPIAVLSLVLAGWSLRRDKWFLAGIFVGFLVLKPQLLIGPVIVLFASRHMRRSVLAGTLTSSLGILLASAMLELDGWKAFVSGFTDVSSPGVATRWDFSILNVTSALPPGLDLVAAAALAIAVTWLVIRIVAQSADPTEIIALGVVLSVLVSPRLVVYDWALLAVAIAWIGRNVRPESPVVLLAGTVALASLSGYISASWLAWLALAAFVVGAAFMKGSHLSVRNPAPT